MSERIHPKNTTEAIAHSRDQLAFISYLLKQTAIPYSLVGGLALKNHFVPYRETGTQTHEDILTLSQDPIIAQTLIGWTDEIRATSDPEFPEVGLEPAHISDSPIPYSLLSSLSGMRVASDGKIFMTYRGIEMETPPETLVTSPHMVNSIEFQAFPKMTILWRYLLRGGVVKPKDQKKVMHLAKEIMEDSSGQPDLKYYAPYLEFVWQINKQYPHIVGAYSFFWKLDQMSGGKISGAKGAVYDLISWFRS
ncbi:MAG: hypothetical protein QG639_913 [Patescibacteria group bacterium]|nr:hypothetical protein [Patescibacteria group bacterium]